MIQEPGFRAQGICPQADDLAEQCSLQHEASHEDWADDGRRHSEILNLDHDQLKNAYDETELTLNGYRRKWLVKQTLHGIVNNNLNGGSYME